MSDLNNKLILSAKELRQYLDISVYATYDLLHTKKISSIKIGKKYLISMISVKKFLESC